MFYDRYIKASTAVVLMIMIIANSVIYLHILRKVEKERETWTKKSHSCKCQVALKESTVNIKMTSMRVTITLPNFIRFCWLPLLVIHTLQLNILFCDCCYFFFKYAESIENVQCTPCTSPSKPGCKRDVLLLHDHIDWYWIKW